VSLWKGEKEIGHFLGWRSVDKKHEFCEMNVDNCLKCELSYPIVGLPPTSHKLLKMALPRAPQPNSVRTTAMVPCPPPASREEERIS
jgi:hypothetical protein